jgi:hypothetical protein
LNCKKTTRKITRKSADNKAIKPKSSRDKSRDGWCFGGIPKLNPGDGDRKIAFDIGGLNWKLKFLFMDREKPK